MKRSTTAVIVGVLALGLVGGGTAVALSNSGEPAPEPSASTPAPVGSDAPVADATEAPVAPESPAADARPAYITEPGEVCDPQNMNDPICAAFYPDQAVLNITARSAELVGLPDAEKIERAHQACDGGEPAESPIYKAGTIAYCNELAPGIDGQPDRYARLIAFYKALGEDGAKAHYADRVMPTPAELGY